MVMRDLGRRIRGGLVFGMWGAALAYLALTGGLRHFLRPEFAWLVGAGAFIAAGFLLAILRHPVPLPLSRTLILLLPLVHIAASEPSSMGGDVFSNRFLGPQSSPADARPSPFPDAADSTPEARVSDAEIRRAFEGGDEPPTGVEPPLNILQLLRNPQAHSGRTVRLLGLVHRDAALARHFGPGREVALYRFVVACCAADALPVTVALEGEIPPLAPDQWVEAEGVFELLALGNGTVPLVRASHVVPVDPPADPFLY
jgi:uncharacterized repeat protein (TIGR03943 family)